VLFYDITQFQQIPLVKYLLKIFKIGNFFLEIKREKLCTKMSIKSDFECSHCQKILKDPIHLPCNCDCICFEHLEASNVLESNSIKCKACNVKFELNSREFKSNQRLQSLLNKEIYLSDEEKSVKKSLENAIQVFFNLLDSMENSKNASIKESHQHFESIRRKIEVQRENLKSQIDKIYAEMIEETNRIEATFKIAYENISPGREFTNFDRETQDLNELFRNVNLSLDSIDKILTERNKSNVDLKLKLKKFTEIGKHLFESNKFEANLNFDQVAFGLHSLVPYSEDSFKSRILIGENQARDLINLCEFNLTDKWTLLYRGSRDGFGAYDFHENCDMKTPTLTILKAQDSGYIFGGYTEASWFTSTLGDHKDDPNAFIFSLTNKDMKPCKMKTKESSVSIFCQREFGPVFGHNDIAICDNAFYQIIALKNRNISRLGSTYLHPKYKFGTNEAETFLAGAHEFRLSEIEVYQRHKFIKMRRRNV
jgi:hypothetical protein